MKKILVAGIGNIFLGDDGFGVEVAQRLAQCELPEAVQVIDFGIRSYDLAYAIMDDDAVIVLVDATQRGQPPGTLYLIEPDLNELDRRGGTVVNGHSMNPVRALQLVQTLGGTLDRPLYLLGCEPAVLDTKDGRIGLSKPVRAAVPKAIVMIRSLVQDLRSETQHVERANTSNS